MKFTDGYWQTRPGHTVLAASQAYEVEGSENRLEVFAPVKTVLHRGDVLNGPGLTFELTSPLTDVLRVRLFRHRGGVERGPHFPVNEQGAEVTVDAAHATITSGHLSARFHGFVDGKPTAEAWKLEFSADGNTLTSSDSKGAATVLAPGGKVYTKDELSLGVGEWVYGLGERFTSFVKNGQSVELWNEDGGTASEQAYKNVPFYLTNRGYGVFVNHPERVSFEVASEKVSRVQFSVEGECLEYWVIYGPTPQMVLERYTALTGRPSRPPAWSFGLWLTTSFTTSYDEATVTSFVDGMASRNIPLSVFHFDCFWMREFHWTDFVWDSRTFPDPQGMLQRLKARGLKICVWINPYIAQRSVLFDQGRSLGYLVKKTDGSVWQTDLWQAGMGVVDFTNPKACRWFAQHLEALVDLGVDSFKTDFGERIPVDVAWFDGSDPQKMHNFYPYLYNQTVFDVLERKKGVGEAVLFARSATAGCQKFPVHWGGDSDSSFPSMAESLRGGLSLGLSGFGFWSHDIGGFEGTPPEALFHRWVAFGLLSSHSRLHGSSSVRVPWVYGERAVEVTKFFTRLKMRLMPYLYAQAVQTCATGVPLMRASFLEFPDDLTSQTLDRQYFLGPSLLVAPVFRADGAVDVWIPEGRWTHLLTGKVVRGPAWVSETHDELSLPLYVRPHTLLPLSTHEETPDSDWFQGLRVRCFELEPDQEAKTTLYDRHGVFRGEVQVTAGSKTLVRATAEMLPFELEWRGHWHLIEKTEQVV